MGRTRLCKLLRFITSNSEDDLTSLEDYVERMGEKQKSIYVAAGASRSEIEKSPFVERALKRGVEVLYLTEPVDEYTIQNLPEFDGKKFQNLAKDGLDFGDETQDEKDAFDAKETEFKPLVDWLGENLKEELEKAVVSKRLDTTPCAFVVNQYGWTGNMQKIMSAQAYAKAGDSNSKFYKEQKKILEINPRHPLVKKLLERSTAESDLEGDEKDAYTKTTVDMTMVLMDTARLRSGFELPEYGDDEEEEEEDDEEEEEEEEEEDEDEEEGGEEEGGEEEGGEEEPAAEEPAAEEPVKDEL